MPIEEYLQMMSIEEYLKKNSPKKVPKTSPKIVPPTIQARRGARFGRTRKDRSGRGGRVQCDHFRRAKQGYECCHHHRGIHCALCTKKGLTADRCGGPTNGPKETFDEPAFVMANGGGQLGVILEKLEKGDSKGYQDSRGYQTNRPEHALDLQPMHEYDTRWGGELTIGLEKSFSALMLSGKRPDSAIAVHTLFCCARANSSLNA